MVQRAHRIGYEPSTPDDAEHDATVLPHDWTVIVDEIWVSDSVSIRMGAHAADVHAYSAFLRVPMSLLPAVTLNSVVLKLTAYATTATGKFAPLEYLGIDADDCPAFDEDRSGLTLIRPSPVIPCSQSDWTKDTVYSLPDFAPLLRLYLDRPGYDPSAGYYWGFVVKKWPALTPLPEVRPREFYASDHVDGATKGALLVIEYTMPDGTEIITETAVVAKRLSGDAVVTKTTAENATVTKVTTEEAVVTRQQTEEAAIGKTLGLEAVR